ncbi:MAG: hypothetical protein HGA87_00580 [Desulfobulbaceae bacterium]|nr:hypothetical protein [Desulfobulbaceae bacterium]
MDYLQWNNLISRHFFNPENAGKEVLLYVNKELIENLGQPFGCGQPDFIKALNEGPGWTKRAGFCQKALQTFLNWRQRGLEYPPYVAYLACFVLATGEDMEVKESAYYPRLNKLLGLPENSRLASFSRTSILWDDLEKWTKEDRHEELGRFVFGIRGSMIWVGLPRFQTLISADERKNLPAFFASASLDPSDPPTQEILLKQLTYHGHRFFQRRTREIFNAKNGDDLTFKEKLLELIMDELEEWDGNVVEQEAGVHESNNNIQSGLRLCMEIDSIAQQAKFSMRLKTNRQFPDEDLFFGFSEPGAHLVCKDAGQGWSKVIRRENNERFDPAVLDWEKGLLLEDPAHKWKARLKASSIRLFISGSNEGLSGWVETQRLERGIPFMLAVASSEYEKIKEWGEKSCAAFRELQVSGMPSGWRLFESDHANASCPGIDLLTVSSSVRLAFRGGVKVRGGNTYLHVAPPSVVLENVSGEEVPMVNGRSLVRVGKEVHLWNLPDDTSVNEILRIEVTAGGKKLTKILRLEAPSLAVDYHAPQRDISGNIILSRDGEKSTFSGAVAYVEAAQETSEGVFIKPSSRRNIFFLGSPGQVCEWPAEKMPAWHPVWAIEKTDRKEWTVTCCRKSLEEVDMAVNVSRDHQHMKDWRELVWINRKRTQLPNIPLVRKKWQKYVEAAKNV